MTAPSFRRSSRRGIARRGALLPTVLVLMAIIGLVAGGATFVGRQDSRSARMTHLQASAMSAADYAHAVTVAGDLDAEARTLPVGGSLVRRIPVGGTGTSAAVRLTRLGESLFSIISDGRADGADDLSARRRSSLIVRLDVAELPFPAVLTLHEESSPAGVLIDGADREPVGWPCRAAQSSDVPPVASVSAPPSESCPGGDCAPEDSAAAVPASPPAGAQAALGTLRSRATLRLAPGSVLVSVGPVVAGGKCSIGIRDNWGDPSRGGPCAEHLPVVHAAGDLAVRGGAGQGILFVDGDLVLSGGFEFTGAVIVAGTLTVEGSGATVIGGVHAGSVQSDVASPLLASFARSSCAVGLVLLSAAPLVPVAERPWAVAR